MICDGIAIILTGSQGTGCWKFPTGAENISFVGTWQWGEYQLRSAASPLALFYSEQTLTHTHAHAHALSLSHTQTIVIGICKTQEKGILGKKRRQVQLRNGFSISRRASAWVCVCTSGCACVCVCGLASACMHECEGEKTLKQQSLFYCGLETMLFELVTSSDAWRTLLGLGRTLARLNSSSYSSFPV